MFGVAPYASVRRRRWPPTAPRRRGLPYGQGVGRRSRRLRSSRRDGPRRCLARARDGAAQLEAHGRAVPAEAFSGHQVHPQRANWIQGQLVQDLHVLPLTARPSRSTTTTSAFVSVGYRVNSLRGARIRRWAIHPLCERMLAMLDFRWHRVAPPAVFIEVTV